MMDALQFRDYVVIPVLKRINLYSDAATQLIIGTFWHESAGITYIKQVGGPACGGLQMEPFTHHDIYDNYLAYKSELKAKIQSQANSFEANADYPDDSLISNLAYQVAMCRVHYLRVSDPLPPANDIERLAKYWKQHYNTQAGKGSVEKFMRHFPTEIL